MINDVKEQEMADLNPKIRRNYLLCWAAILKNVSLP
jgi:hypothetical protein